MHRRFFHQGQQNKSDCKYCQICIIQNVVAPKPADKIWYDGSETEKYVNCGSERAPYAVLSDLIDEVRDYHERRSDQAWQEHRQQDDLHSTSERQDRPRYLRNNLYL